jgi:hypothetical protein
MKKLLPIYGHIFPLHFTPFDGTNSNANAKSITLSQKFKDLNFSICLNKTGINSTTTFTLLRILVSTQKDIHFVQSLPFSEMNGLSIIREKSIAPASVLSIESVNRRKIFRNNRCGTTNTTFRFKTWPANFQTPGINTAAYINKYSTPGKMNIFRYNNQNTF